MSANVVAFFRRAVSRDWSAQELAEFYRVEAALIQSGLHVCSDRGVADEGDPWFIFCRAEDDEVIVHFARIDGQYLISAPAYGGNVTGQDFRTLVRGLVERHPVLRPARQTGNVTWHPSALLLVLVASALLKMGHNAEAAPVRPGDGLAAGADRVPLQVGISGLEHAGDTVVQEAQQNAVILAAIACATSAVDMSSVPLAWAPVLASEPVQPVHTGLALATPLDTSSATDVGGSHGVVPASPQLLSLFSLPQDPGAHAHDLAFWQVQTTPVVSGWGPPVDQGAAESLAPVATLQAPAQPNAELTNALGTNATLHSGAQDVVDSVLSNLGGNVPIVYVSTLPVALSTPLNESVHTATATATTHLTTESASSSGGALPGDATTTPAVPATITAGSSVAFDSGGTASVAEVLTIMQNFATEVGPHLAVVVTPTQVVEYDYYAIDTTPAAVTAVTYDFANGSHLSLVGLPAEISHALV
jgi:hypothetical protein